MRLLTFGRLRNNVRIGVALSLDENNVHSIGSSSVRSVVRYGLGCDHIARGTHTAATIAEFLYRWVFDSTTGIADAVSPLLGRGVSRRGVIVGCGWCHLIG